MQSPQREPLAFYTSCVSFTGITSDYRLLEPCHVNTPNIHAASTVYPAYGIHRLIMWPLHCLYHIYVNACQRGAHAYMYTTRLCPKGHFGEKGKNWFILVMAMIEMYTVSQHIMRTSHRVLESLRKTCQSGHCVRQLSLYYGCVPFLVPITPFLSLARKVPVLNSH